MPGRCVTMCLWVFALAQRRCEVEVAVARLWDELSRGRTELMQACHGGLVVTASEIAERSRPSVGMTDVLRRCEADQCWNSTVRVICVVVGLPSSIAG